MAADNVYGLDGGAVLKAHDGALLRWPLGSGGCIRSSPFSQANPDSPTMFRLSGTWRNMVRSGMPLAQRRWSGRLWP